MSKLSYENWLELYAQRCSKCKGERAVWVDRVLQICDCQYQARRKARLEQIDIYPPELKYKEWGDFTGVIYRGGQIVGKLTDKSAITSRHRAFSYCFNRDYSPDILKDRANNLCILNHLSDGQNVIIAGSEGSGRSLLAVLILKEVAEAARIVGKAVDYRWVKFYEVIDAARWDNSNPLDRAKLDNFAELDFLFLDDVSVPKGGHNAPPDHTAMNILFGSRRSRRSPLVATCSLDALREATTTSGEYFTSLYGSEFLKSMSDDSIIFIELHKA